MSNHKLDKDTEDVEEEDDQEKVESKKPVAEALRSPAPPMDHMDEYYYYDDEYYYDYEPPARPPVRPPPTTTKPPSKYPNFPPAKKPVSKYEDKYKHKQPSPSKHYNHHKKETHDYKHRKPSSNSFKSSYNIESTIKRLQDIKKSQLERKGVPALPNPWEKLNSPSKSESRKSTAYERNSKPKPRPAWPSSPDYDYRYEDQYESRNRNGYAAERNGGATRANPLALLIAPLAGIALLTAAAAVAINPVLVTVSVTGKRRRRRDLDTMIGSQEGITPELEEKIHEMQVLEKFMSSIPENTNYQQQVLSMYLSCSGYTEMTNTCLDRVVCEYANKNNSVSEEERDVISIVLYNIMANEYVSEGYKDRLRVAARAGRNDGQCQVFECSSLNEMGSNGL